MIINGGRQIMDIYHGTTPLVEMYYGKYLIWTTIRSCYGNGYWINDRPWLNEDGWKN